MSDARLAVATRAEESGDLLAALRAQDPAVARPLWDRFAPAIFRILRYTLGPDAQIDDAVQVVLLCVFRRGRRLGPRSDVRQLVMKVAARIARGELRRRPGPWRVWRSRPRAVRDVAASGAGGPESDAVMRFYRILDRLSAPDRIAFVLHHIEGLEVRDVAAATGVSPARTLRRLRRSYGTIVEGIERDAPVLRAR